MTSLAAGIIDPTKVGKYRVVLSDALLGKDPKELYTGIRYNHKPKLSSNTAPHQARIKSTNPTDSSSASSSYELSFQDDGGRYAYQGTRGHEENKYVLIFDPEREVFVLHRVDSMFNMNLTRTPTDTDPEHLQQEYSQLEAHRPSRTSKPASKAPPSKAPSSKASKPKKPTFNNSKPSAAKKADAPKPAPSKKAHHDSEDESSDDDLLTIEDPGGVAPATNRDFSPGFIDHPRRFSDFIEEQSKEGDGEEEEDDGLEEVEALNDADGEEEEEEDDDDDASENFKLPSPIHRQMMGQNINGIGGHNSLGITTQSAPEEQVSDEDEEEMEDVEAGGASVAQDDMAVDLEAMLIAELEEESEVSEED